MMLGLLIALWQPAPAPTMPTFVAVDLAGNTVESKDLAGKAVFFNVWATWCKPCTDELPIIQAMHTQFGADGLTVVGVSVDEDPETAALTAKKLGLTFVNLSDPGSDLAKQFKMQILPTSILFGPDGKQLWRKDEVIQAREPGLGAAIKTALAGLKK